MEATVIGSGRRRGRKRKIRDVENVTVDRDGKAKIMETRMNYEDGDYEDLESGELKVLLVADSKVIGEWLERKKKLDELLLSKDPTNGGVGAIEVEEVQEKAIICADGDSSSDSCEDAQEQNVSLEEEAHVVPPPELPPSSGHIGVPEDAILKGSHLKVQSFHQSARGAWIGVCLIH
ncbi:unnamed protein product [Fraxinus pennsylvanica]|uniref:Uncharacterized protein n=1 Tax=Fraxinus pennsylvanica TaxID=56036 RepID=A0AAD1ZZP3_9LAMI|nr:unnamed protein product [Fraxinus pennsylvanica]